MFIIFDKELPMVDLRHTYLSEKFRFFENFEDIANRYETYRQKQAMYHYRNNISETLKKDFGISTDMSNTLANTIQSRASSDNRNHFHNSLLALSLIDFAKQQDMQLNETEKLAIYLQYLTYDTTWDLATNVQATCEFVKALLGRYMLTNEVLDLIQVSNTQIGPNDSHLKIIDLNNSMYAYPYKSFVQTQLCLYKEYCHNQHIKLNTSNAVDKNSPDFNVFMSLRNKDVDEIFNKPDGLFYNIELKHLQRKSELNEEKFRAEYM